MASIPTKDVIGRSKKMTLFSIDEKKCKRDGICAAVCPLGIIEMENENAVPVPAPDADELCIKCGHCVAVCPTAAFSHSEMMPDECSPVRRDWLQDPEKTEHFLRSRRSIRTYKAQAIPRDVLTKLIHIARFAPSGHNTQPVQWLVIYDSDEVKRLAGIVIDWMRYMLKENPQIAHSMHMDLMVTAWDNGLERICRGAPHVVVTHAPKKEQSAPPACTLALSYFELAAPSLGLGACWGGYFDAASNVWPPMQQALALPEGHASFGAMMVGYPEYAYHRLPLRSEPLITWR